MSNTDGCKVALACSPAPFLGEFNDQNLDIHSVPSRQSSNKQQLAVWGSLTPNLQAAFVCLCHCSSQRGGGCQHLHRPELHSTAQHSTELTSTISFTACGRLYNSFSVFFFPEGDFLSSRQMVTHDVIRLISPVSLRSEGNKSSSVEIK